MNKILTKLLTFSVGLAMAIGVGVALKGNETKGARATDTTYIFTSKSWAATSGGSAANWTSGKDGAGFSNNGIQVTNNSSYTGANGTSPDSFSNITSIVLTYNTNKTAGAGTAVVKVGSNTAVSKNWAYIGDPQTDDGRIANYTLTWSYATPQSGNVKITLNTTTNSIYLVSCKISTSDEPPAPTTFTVTYDKGDNGVYDGTTTHIFPEIESGSTHTIKTPAQVGISPKTYYEFVCWNDGTSDITTSTITVNSDVTLTAIWSDTRVKTVTSTNDSVGNFSGDLSWTGNSVGLGSGNGYVILKDGASIVSGAITDLDTSQSVTITINTRTYGGDSYKTTDIKAYSDAACTTPISGKFSISATSNTLADKSTTLTFNSGVNVDAVYFKFTSSTTSAANGPGIHIITLAYTRDTTTKYNLVYDANAGSDIVTNMPSNELHKAGTYTLSSKIPVRSNYAFKGWAATGSSTTSISSVTISNADVTVYAIWNIKHTVTFDSNGGSEVPSIPVEHGTAIGTLPEPSKADNAFNGWKLQNTETIIDSDYVVNSDITLVAQWTRYWSVTGSIDNATLSSTASIPNGQALNITITPDDHYSLPDTLTVTMGQATLSPGPSGYTYEIDDDSGVATFVISAVTGDVTIEGICEEDAKYDITYKSGNHSSSSDVVIQDVYAGDYQIETYASLEFACESGYKFSVWECNDSTYEQGSIFELNSDVIFTALYDGVYSFDLTKASYSSASTSKVEWTSEPADMTLTKGNSSTNADNYLGGTNNHTRMYASQVLTISLDSEIPFSKIVILCTGETYATPFTDSTWTNATVSQDGAAITIIPTDFSKDVVAVIDSAVRVLSVDFVYDLMPMVRVVTSDRCVALAGDSIQIEATIVNPTGDEGEIQFASSNTDVVTINKDTGELESLSAGETTITVSAEGARSTSFEFGVISDSRTGLTIDDAYNLQEAVRAAKFIDSEDEYYVKNVLVSIDTKTYLNPDYILSNDPFFSLYNPSFAEGKSSADAEPGVTLIAKGDFASWENGGYGMDTPVVVDIIYPDPTGLIISGEMTKTSYTTKSNSWNPSGLVVTATFESISNKVVTDKVTWTYSVPTPKSVDNPSDTPFNLTVYATYGSLTASTVVSVVVKDAGMTIHEIDGGWSLVTNASTLNSGDEIIITNKGSTLGAMAYSTGNNVSATSVTASEGELTDTGDAAYLTIESAGSGMFYINDGDYYWYAASSGSNHLKGAGSLPTGDNLKHYKWSFTYSTDHMSIVATNSTNRNVMQFNPNNGSPIFSCYATASQTDLQVYKRTGVYDVKEDLIDAVDLFYNPENFQCTSSGTSFDYSKWSTNQSDLADLVDDYHLNRIVADEFGNKIERFLATYDYVIRKYSSNPTYKNLDFLGRFDTDGINYGTLFKTNTFGILNAKITNTSIIVVISSIVAIASFAGYFYYKKKKDN